MLVAKASNATGPSFVLPEAFSVPTTHANSSAAELDEWHHQSQSLLNGDVTVDDAAAALDKVQAQAKPQK